MQIDLIYEIFGEIFDFDDSDIIRLLTPDEIEEYEANKNTIKYNL